MRIPAFPFSACSQEESKKRENTIGGLAGATDGAFFSSVLLCVPVLFPPVLFPPIVVACRSRRRLAAQRLAAPLHAVHRQCPACMPIDFGQRQLAHPCFCLATRSQAAGGVMWSMPVYSDHRLLLQVREEVSTKRKLLACLLSSCKSSRFLAWSFPVTETTALSRVVPGYRTRPTGRWRARPAERCAFSIRRPSLSCSPPALVAEPRFAPRVLTLHTHVVGCADLRWQDDQVLHVVR
jgi:hypothetical protein